MNKKNKLVSIIIPTYNRKEILTTLLNSISKQNYKQIEIIVIDDASTDQTYEKIKKEFPNVVVYYFKQRCGPALGKNFGFLKSKGD